MLSRAEMLNSGVCVPTQPIKPQIVHEFAEFVEAYGLHKITVDMVVIRAGYIPLGF